MSTEVTFLRRFPCQFKGDTGYANHLIAGVAHGVPCRVRFAVPLARLAKIEAAQKFADKQNIRAVDYLRAQRRVGGERRIRKRGAQIGKTAQRLANLQQACFGPAIRGQGIEFVAADSAQQYRIAFERCIERGRRQRRALLP